MSGLRFDGRAVIVTGAAKGIGAEYAREFARRGASLVIEDVDRKNLDGVADEVRTLGAKVVVNYGSAGDSKTAEELVAAAVREFGRLDALVNNAAWRENPIPQEGSLVQGVNANFEDVSLEHLDSYFAVNVRGAFLLTQHAYRVMMKQRYGRIVLVSSSAGMYGIRYLSAYGASKAALIGLMNVVANEGADYGIRINTVLPGARSSWRTTNARASETASRSSNRPKWLVDRNEPKYVVPMTVYLASEACDRTHRMYNASGSGYSRAFIGAVPGWMGTRIDEPPTVEELQAHLGQIEDMSGHIVVDSIDDYSKFSVENARKAFGD